MRPGIPNLVPVFLALTSFLKFEATCEKDDWTKLNDVLKEKLKPINFHISRAHDPEDISRLGDHANILIRDFLVDHPEVFEAVETNKKSKHAKHTSKTLAEAIKLKKELKKKAEAPNATLEDRKNFRLALRAISDLKKAEKRKEELKNFSTSRRVVFQEQMGLCQESNQGKLGRSPSASNLLQARSRQILPPDLY